MASKGTYLLIAGGGAVLLWSGIKGKSWADALRQIVSGKNPQQAATVNAIKGVNTSTVVPDTAQQSPPINPSTVPVSGGSVVAYKSFAASLMILHGWGLGGQWSSFQNVVIAESGWRNNAQNASGAYGIAQALGHGTANTRGSVTNQYGNYGTPDAMCRAANSGNGFAQLVWMCNYIAQAYGNPGNAWNHEQTDHNY